MNLMDKIMSVCSQQMAYSEVFCPYLACSFGAHVFNLHNVEHNIYTNGAIPRNVKLNVVLVSPPGLSKNESIYRFIGKKQYSLLTVLDGMMDKLPDDTVPPFCKVTGEITSAGFVGSVREDGEEEYGDAFIYRKGIIAYTEIASLFNKSEHSQDLINHVLRVMGDNQIVKRLAHIDITHDTFVTVWGGIQPERIETITRAGMDRRAIYVVHDWLDEEIQKMIEFRASRKTPQEVEDLKNDIQTLRLDIPNFIERVKLIDEINWYFDRKEYATMPADLDTIDALSIGYALMTEDDSDGTLGNVLDIRMTPQLDGMLRDIQVMKGRMKSTILSGDLKKLLIKTATIEPSTEHMKDPDILAHPEKSIHTVEYLQKVTGLSIAFVRDGMRKLCLLNKVHENTGYKNRKFYHRI